MGKKESDDIEYKRLLHEMYKESIAQFDRNVLYISSGALGISLTFISDIVDLNKIFDKHFLAISWVLLTFVIVVSLASHFFSMKALNALMKHPDLDKNKKARRYNGFVKLSNVFMLVGLPLGILSLIIFVLINI